MNPQMKKLADEARFTDQVPYPSEDEVFQKFGELIVKKCINIIGEENYTMLTGKAYCAQLKRHFGVEE